LITTLLVRKKGRGPGKGSKSNREKGICVVLLGGGDLTKNRERKKKGE